MTKAEVIDELHRMLSDCVIPSPLRGLKQIDRYCEAISRATAALEHDKPYGSWIKHENSKLGKCMKISYECDVCGKFAGCEYFVRRSFCPNCGADMRFSEDKTE